MARLLIRRTPAQDALRCVAFAITGLALAALAIWLGAGLLDGFQGRYMGEVLAKFRRKLPLALLFAAITGLLLHAYFEAALTRRNKAWVVVLGIVRAFGIFMLLGMGILFAAIAGLLDAPIRRVLRRLKRLPAEGGPSVFQDLLVAQLWILMLPFSLLGIESEGDIEIPLDSVPPRIAAVFPILFVMLLAAPGVESEATGDWVDPVWLWAYASYCLADCAIVVGVVAPRLEIRERAREQGVRQRTGGIT